MDALIRWMIALSWTTAGISLSFATYTHPIDWLRFNDRMAEIDTQERMGITAETNLNMESQERQLEFRERKRKRWEEYRQRTEIAMMDGVRLWWIATALFTLNALGLIVIHKRGFDPIR